MLTKGPNTSAPAIATQNSEADIKSPLITKISLAAAGQLVTSKLAFPAVQASAEWRHGISQLGEVKYPVHFPHFEYVNPKAPKGGVARQIGLDTFDSFNLALSGVKGRCRSRNRSFIRSIISRLIGRAGELLRAPGRRQLDFRRTIPGCHFDETGGCLARW